MDNRWQSLFTPRSVAIVGASRDPGKPGHRLLARLVAGGFAGRIIPVNPHGGEILGLPVVAAMTACPRGVELVVLALAADQVLEQAKAAMARGCRGLVVVDGFRGSGGSGQQEVLAQWCRERQVALLGPDSPGLIHRPFGLNLSLLPSLPPLGGVSLFSQSGAVAAAALDWMAGRKLGLCKMVGLGSEAGINAAELLTHLAHDPQTTVIACQLERVVDGAGFLKAATEAARQKPVVLLAGGGDEWRAMTARTGVVQATEWQGWLDAMLALSRGPLPAGHRVAVLAHGRGLGGVMTDALTRQGLQPCTAPVDLGEMAPPEDAGRALAALADNQAVDGVVAVVVPHPTSPPLEMARALSRPQGWGKPLLVVALGGHLMAEGRAALDDLGVAHFSSPEQGAAALAALVGYGRWRRRGPRVVPQFPVNRPRVARMLHRGLTLAMRHLRDLECKEILHAYGLNLPEGEVAATVAAALDAAERLGYPLDLHLLSPDLHLVAAMETKHREVATPQGVADGFDLLALRFAREVPAGRFEGIFLEKTLTRGRGVRVVVQRDGLFGPLLRLGPPGGQGGCQLAPLTGAEAMAMLDAAPGPWGPADLEAMVEALQRLGQLAVDFSEILEIHIDFLVAGRPGLPLLVTDCSMSLQQREPVS